MLNALLWITSGALVGIAVDYFEVNLKKEYMTTNVALGILGGYLGGFLVQYILWRSLDEVNMIAFVVSIAFAFQFVRFVDYFFGLVKKN
jgi:uncharacterized membrane protein YeaQ/YmgE (transglycosylase-associated protein family)